MPDGFVHRIINALGETPRALAQRLGLSYKHDLQPIMFLSEAELVDSDIDEVYSKLSNAVDERIGQLLAAREALQRKLQADRTRRAARMERVRNR